MHKFEVNRRSSRVWLKKSENNFELRMYNAVVAIPLQLICQLAIPGSHETAGNVTCAVDPRFSPDATNLTALPNDYTAFPDIGVAYKYYPYLFTWNTAREYCISQGSVLAEIDTFEKMRNAMTLKEERRNLHVGLHRYFSSQQWTSVKTGLTVTMIPWAPESNIEKSDHRCMRMWNDGRGLAANDCEYRLHFICEIPMMSQK